MRLTNLLRRKLNKTQLPLEDNIELITDLLRISRDEIYNYFCSLDFQKLESMMRYYSTDTSYQQTNQITKKTTSC